MIRRCFLVMGLLLAASIHHGAGAQEFPARHITLVMGIAPGGIMDTAGRIYGEAVSRSLGQNIVIENKPGAGGALAAVQVQNADPDGYTIILIAGAQHATIPLLQPVQYSPIKGLAPIAVLFNSAAILTVPADSPASTIPELLALAKSKPGGLMVGAPGVASPAHLLAARIGAATKIPMQFVQYRGAGPMMTDLATSRIDAGISSYPASSAFFVEKKLKAIAVDAPRRLTVLPDVPTFAELNLGEARVASWFGIAAPAGTPVHIINKLRSEFAKASEDPNLVRRLENVGILANVSTPQEMDRLMNEEWAIMNKILPELGLSK